MKQINIFILLLIGVSSFAQNTMIVAYLPTYRFKTSSEIDFCKITHLNICFVNPDEKGEIIEPDSLPEMLQVIKKKNPNLKIFISLAGGALHKHEEIIWQNFVDKPEKRKILVKNISKFVEKHNFDGVDVDLEWHNVTKGYSDFVLELKIELDKNNKLISSALPGIKRFKNISDEALKAFDFINIMAYDERGSWAPKNAGPHSSFDFAKRSISFWNKKHGVPLSKLCLGLPFYGYDFSDNNKTTSKMYKEIIALDVSNQYKDETNNIFYNSVTTIEKKVEYAIENNLAGVMIWELGQDTTNELSLLTAIHYKVKMQNANSILSDCDISEEKLFAMRNNKFKKSVTISINEIEQFFSIESKDINKVKVKIFDKKGREKTKKLKPYRKKQKKYFLTKRLKKGFYVLEISKGKYSFRKKLIIDKKK